MNEPHYFIALLRTKPGLRDFPKRGVEFLPKQVNLFDDQSQPGDLHQAHGALDDGPNQADLHRLPLVKQQESHGNLERHQQ